MIKHRYFNVGNVMMYGNYKTEKEAFNSRLHADDKYIAKVSYLNGKPISIDIIYEYIPENFTQTHL